MGKNLILHIDQNFSLPLQKYPPSAINLFPFEMLEIFWTIKAIVPPVPAATFEQVMLALVLTFKGNPLELISDETDFRKLVLI